MSLLPRFFSRYTLLNPEPFEALVRTIAAACSGAGLEGLERERGERERERKRGT